MPRQVIILLCFFLSGVAGLIYEVVWAKYLSLFLGNTAQAHTLVLATFMGGLALGNYLFGRLADRVKSRLGLYGWLEIGIGVYGLLFPFLLSLLTPLYIALAQTLDLSSAPLAFLKFSLSLLSLLLPTTFMGGTLPVLSRYLVSSLREVEVKVAQLYALNSFGAVVGSLLAGFFLIREFGLDLSLTIAAGLNLLVGLTALFLRRKESRGRDRDPLPVSQSLSLTVRESGSLTDRLRDRGTNGLIPVSSLHLPPEPHETPYTPFQIRAALLGIFLSGFAAMVYEIAWIRLLSLVLGSSTYSFSLMLAAFISGLTLGSLLISVRLFSRFDSYLLFGLAEMGIALSAILTFPLYERLPYHFLKLTGILVRLPHTFWLYESLQFGLCFSLMLLPTLFFGMTLPLVSRIGSRRLADVGREVGGVFAANTAGTVLGATLSGLLFLPALGVKRLLELGVAINIVIGILTLTCEQSWGWRKKAVGGVSALLFLFFYLIAFPRWDLNVLAGGQFRWRGFYPEESYAEFKRRWKEEKLLYYKDGPNGTVTVIQDKEGALSLKINGKTDASSKGDLPTQILIGQIPLLLLPTAKDILVIGLGSGITCGTALRHPIKRLDVVEISEAVVEGASYFAPHNYNALSDPRLHLYLEDAKTFLQVTDTTYDVIISEPSNPWMAGIGDLFSREFYEEAKRHLRPGGLMIQWLHAYEMTDDILKLMLRTFSASYAHVSLWNPLGMDILLIGSSEPLSPNFAKMEERFAAAAVQEELRRIGIENLPTLLSLQVAATEEVRRAWGRGRLNEDLFPILEYEAPRAFFLGSGSTLLSRFDARQKPLGESSLYIREYFKDRRLTSRDFQSLIQYQADHGSATSVYEGLLKAWLDHYPQEPKARWAWVEWYDKKGEKEKAEEMLTGLLAESPNEVKYLEKAADLAYHAYTRQRSFLTSVSYEPVLSLYERCLVLSREGQDRIYQKMAAVYHEAGLYGEALSTILKAISVQKDRRKTTVPKDALLLEAGLLASELGDRDRAALYLKEALKANPDNGAARRALEALTDQQFSL